MAGGRWLKSVAAVIMMLIAAVAIYVYREFDPVSSGVMFPQCPSKYLTGLDCPGCGSQRALHSLLNGDIAGAFRHNAIFIPALLMVAALLAASLLRKRYPGFHKALNSTTSLIVVLIVIVVWTVVRNLFL